MPPVAVKDFTFAATTKLMTSHIQPQRTRHTSLVTRHTLHVTRHMPHVTCCCAAAARAAGAETCQPRDKSPVVHVQIVTKKQWGKVGTYNVMGKAVVDAHDDCTAAFE